MLLGDGFPDVSGTDNSTIACSSLPYEMAVGRTSLLFQLDYSWRDAIGAI